MERSMFFDARIVDGEADRAYGSSDIAALIKAYYTDGVLSPTSLTVEGRSTLEVAVNPGAAVIHGYTYVLDEKKYVAVEATEQLPRVDLVVLRLDMGLRTIYPKVIKGTPAASPSAPSYNLAGGQIDIPLAEVTIGAGMATTLFARFKDRREFAAARIMEGPFKNIVRTMIESVPMLDENELDEIRMLMSSIHTNGAGNRVLCDDGNYRECPSLLERYEAARFTEAGEYVFVAEQHPSATGYYDVEVIGAGGAGGSMIGENKRGGGGGAGVMISVGAMRLPQGAVTVKVGAGGVGASNDVGGDGEKTTFYTITAPGGEGGWGGDSVDGGDGARCAPFYAESGKRGSLNVAAEPYILGCGAGAASVFGPGGQGYMYPEVSLGQNATASGAGGSGAGGPELIAHALAGGRGADGAVIVYAYRVPEGV